MKPIVPVVFATDDIFAPYCGASIASLIANRDPERKYAIYIFYDDLSQEHIDKISSMAVENVTIECLCITPYIDRDLLYTHKRLTVATYFRFFVATVLPQYDKLLYLDSDIAILGDVGELYDIDIGDNLLGGVVIYRAKDTEQRLKEEYLRELMGVSPDRYVNAGILSMNLKAFREQDIQQKCLDYIGEHRELRWLDQDVLNAVCKGQIHFLPEGWNMSQFYFEEDYRENADISGVRLIHYIDRIKPWLVSFKLSHLFFYQYAQNCPYAEELRQKFLDNNRESMEKLRHDTIVKLKEDARRSVRHELLPELKEEARRSVEREMLRELKDQARQSVKHETLVKLKEEARKSVEHETLIRLKEEARESVQRENKKGRQPSLRELKEQARESVRQETVVNAKKQSKGYVKQEIRNMAVRGEVGPRFLMGCMWKWCKAKVRRIGR